MRPIDKESKLFALLDDMANTSSRPKEFNSLFDSLSLNASYIPLNIREDDILFTMNGLRNSQITVFTNII
jgi:shikimate 5-dehydrogenase